jgi:hypothetical protein
MPDPQGELGRRLPDRNKTDDVVALPTNKGRQTRALADPTVDQPGEVVIECGAAVFGADPACQAARRSHRLGPFEIKRLPAPAGRRRQRRRALADLAFVGRKQAARNSLIRTTPADCCRRTLRQSAVQADHLRHLWLNCREPSVVSRALQAMNHELTTNTCQFTVITIVSCTDLRFWAADRAIVTPQMLGYGSDRLG